MTALVQTTLDLDDHVRIACIEDAQVVLNIKRRRRHDDHPIWREFVVASDREKKLPSGLLTRTRVRSHLVLEPGLVERSLHDALRDELPPLGLRCEGNDPRFMHCSYLREGIDLDYLVFRIVRIT